MGPTWFAIAANRVPEWTMVGRFAFERRKDILKSDPVRGSLNAKPPSLSRSGFQNAGAGEIAKDFLQVLEWDIGSLGDLPAGHRRFASVLNQIDHGAQCVFAGSSHDRPTPLA